MAILNLNTDHPDVSYCELSLEEVRDWLVDPGAELMEVNSAIDNAASWAADYDGAYVLIKINGKSGQ